MDTLGYILELGDYREPNLGDIESLFLRRIADGYSSAYSLFLYLKSTDTHAHPYLHKKPMAYKNVNKRVRRLEELKLIEFEKKSGRNAKHYKLTTKGLWYIISDVRTYDTGLFIKYKDNIILQTLLYPYFGYETIQNCREFSSVHTLISQYLRECCFITFSIFKQYGGPEHYALVTSHVSKMLKDGSWTNIKNHVGEPISTSNPYVLAIEEMLVLHARSFAFKLSLKYIQKLPRVVLYDDGCETIGLNDPSFFINSPYEIRTRSILAKDTKFMKFLETLVQDFDIGHKDLFQLKIQHG